MCYYENITQEFTSCGHEIQRPGMIPIRECEQYLRRLQRYRKADRKWREGSQERCPPTPFNMHSCPTRVVRPGNVFRQVVGLCWNCEAPLKQIDAPPRLRVEVREWKDYRDDSWRGLTPESEAGTSYDDYDFDMDGLSPISPPASSSEADSEEMDDERFGPDVQIPQSLTVEPAPTPRRSQRIAERANKATTPDTTTTRGRQRVL